MQEYSLAATTTKLMTFAEFEQLPSSESFRLELHHGELVQVPPPKWKHQQVQVRLQALLTAGAGAAGYAILEMGFRPKPEREYWIADVAFIRRQRFDEADPDGYFEGAPEMVIEVLSPSNTASEMLDREKICLENGAREFWVVDIDRRQVKVSTPDGHTVTYKAGQQIPLLFSGDLAVDDIFA